MHGAPRRCGGLGGLGFVRQAEDVPFGVRQLPSGEPYVSLNRPRLTRRLQGRAYAIDHPPIYLTGQRTTIRGLRMVLHSGNEAAI